MMNENIPKIYTIPQIVKKIHEADPDSAVSAPLLRTLVKNGSIVPVVNYRNKALLNYDDIISFFANGYKTMTAGGQSTPVAEKNSPWAADEDIFSVAAPHVVKKAKHTPAVKSSFFSVDPDIYPVNGGVN